MKKRILKTLTILSIILLSACSGASLSSQSQSISKEISTSETQPSSEHISSSETQPSSKDAFSSNQKESQGHSSTHVHLSQEPVKENIIEADCIKQGSYDEVIYCQDCHKEMSRTKHTIPALGHNYSEWKIIRDSDYTNTGLRQKVCSRCNDVVEEIIPVKQLFSFKLNQDEKSYTLNGYTKVYEGEDIIIPESYQNLPVSVIDINIETRDNCIPNIYLPNISLEIKKISVYCNKYVNIAKEAGNDTFPNIEIYNFNLFFKGNVNNWLNNITLSSAQSVYSNNIPHLYFYDNDQKQYINTDVLTIPEGIETIKRFAFYGFAFKRIVCPTSLKTIQQFSILSDCLESISLNERVAVKGFAISGNNVKSISLPKGVTLDNYSLSLPKLLEINILEGVTTFNQNAFVESGRLIKINNQTTNNFSYPSNVLITNENAFSSAIFTYEGFDFALVNGQLYLLSANKPYRNEELKLPTSVIYNNVTYQNYSIRSFAFKGTAPMGGANWPTIDEILTIYGGFNEFIKRNNAYNQEDIFVKLYIPKALNSVSLTNDGFGESSYVFGAPRFLKDVYYDGTKEDFYKVFDTNDKLASFKSERVTIHAKDSANEEITFKI